MKCNLSTILSLICSLSVFSQTETFTIDDEAAEVAVSGGSTLHDWVVRTTDVTEFPPSLTIDLTKVEIADFDFKVDVKSMDGNRGATMDNKIYEALLSDKHPHITYDQNGATQDFKINEDGSFELKSNGSLSIAGVDKDVNVTINGYLEDGKLILEASHPLTMSAFNIEPPSAMFGQIQTKDDIVVKFRFVYTQN